MKTNRSHDPRRMFRSVVARVMLLLLVLMLATGTAVAYAQGQSGAGLWRDVSEAQIRSESQVAGVLGQRDIVPERYRVVAVDLEMLDAILESAPPEGDPGGRADEVMLSLPLPDGGFALFTIVESPIMEPELAAKYPEIRTYLGQGVDDATQVTRVDRTPAGFHAMVLSSDGSVFVDPYRRGDIENYISYYKKDFVSDEPWQEVPDLAATMEEARELLGDELAGSPSGLLAASGTTLRTYRAAVAAQGEYTAFHGGTVAGALAAQVTTMNRVNLVYEHEVAIRMVLVANNNSIIYTNAATDPYTSNACTGTTLNENQANIDAVIGSANYDIGHVFNTSGGGLAGLGVVCGGSKARGCTGRPTPAGDPFDIDYVAHEMGHEFDGDHTFNADGTGTGSCNLNRNGGAAYEPGSGSTIMAYAGICGAAHNLQANSHDYFHTKSFDQIVAFSTSGGGSTCDVPSSTGNSPPSVNAGSDYTIPRETPFMLTGSASDPDGHPLTYCWEEYDLGAANPPYTDDGSRPLFRSYPPVTSPSRTFPRLADILSGTSSDFEVLPTTDRTMEFRLTARDNRAGGGGVDYDTMVVTVENDAGPFAVTSPNGGETWNATTDETVTWNVAATNLAPVSCTNVDIRLSTDGGLTFGTSLASATTNDGSETVTVPNVETTTARVRVMCSDNIFFDISDGNFTIVPAGDVEVTKTAIEGVVNAGEQVHYTILVRNLGPQEARDVQVQDTIPAGTTLVSVAATGGGTCVGTSTVTCSWVSPFAPGAEETVTMSLLVNAGTDPGSLLNTATGSSSNPDVNPGNDSGAVTVVVEVLADLQVFKDCKPDDPILVGKEAVCTITVGNVGPSTARAVDVDDEYLTDGDWDFGTITTSGGTCDAPVGPTDGAGSVHCDVGDMDPGDVVTIEIPVTGTEPGNINDHVAVSSDTPDPNSDNNWDEDSVTVYEAADLRITKFGKPEGEVLTGEVLTYTVVVDNLGPSPAVGAALKDILQSDGTFDLIDITSDRDAHCVGIPGPASTAVAASSWPPPAAPPTGVLPPTGVEGIVERLELDCTLDADLEELVADGPPNSGRWILTLRVRAYESQDMNNVADVVSDTDDPNEENNHAEVLHEITSEANLEVTKTATGWVKEDSGDPVLTVDEVTAGLAMSYTVTVKNNGPARAENVVVKDTLPPGIVVTGVVAEQGTCTTGTPGDPENPLVCEIGRMGDGDEVVVTIWVQVPASLACDTMLENDVVVYSDMFDGDTGGNRAYNLTVVRAAADLGVSKVQDPDIVLAGQPLEYTITVWNQGPSDAPWVLIEDLFPAELENVAWECVPVGGGATCPEDDPSIGDLEHAFSLPAGQYVYFTVSGVRQLYPDWYFVNEVRVSTQGCVQDPDPSDNVASDENRPYFSVLPIVLNLREDVKMPDLMVSHIEATKWDVVVTIVNTGLRKVTSPFWVEAYVGPATGPSGVDQHWRDLGEEGMLWWVTDDALPMKPGETLKVRRNDAYYRRDEIESRVFWPIEPGTKVWAQVDSRGGPNGLVMEIHEQENQYYNNIAGPKKSIR